MMMNSNFRPIPATMPVRAAADLMVRRGECPNFFRALAIIQSKRRRDYGRVEITPADKAAFNHIEPPMARLPYKDDTYE